MEAKIPVPLRRSWSVSLRGDLKPGCQGSIGSELKTEGVRPLPRI
ncbi:MAG: hypothetical protein ACLVJY_13100 [Frisingicoccus sp.]